MKIIEDLQAPLHIGAGRLPDWLRHKRCLLALDRYADELYIFRCIAVQQGVHRVPKTRKTRELAASFLDKHRVRGRIYKSHFPLIENHFQQGVAGYEIDAEGAFALKYLFSRFDKIRVPQMDIGIYEEHALLITKLDKVTKYYACAECQARFTKNAICGGMQRFLREECLRWRVEETESSRPKLLTKNRSTATGLMRERRSAGRNTRPMEGCAYPSSNVWPRWRKKNCRISSGWFLLGNKRGVSVPWLPLAWLSRVFSRTAQGSGRFRKNKARQERADTRDAVCKSVG